MHDIHSVHREKERGQGDLRDHLVDWYSLVAKPAPRHMWDDMPDAKKAVKAEWAKLRQAGNGNGTWDQDGVREYYNVRNGAQAKFEKTCVSTRFGTLFDLCVEKHSELEAAKRKCKAWPVEERGVPWLP